MTSYPKPARQDKAQGDRVGEIDAITYEVAATLFVTESHVTASLLPFVPASVEIARRAGITDNEIETPDLKLIFRVCQHFGDEGPVRTAGWAKRLLVEFGYWDDRASSLGTSTSWGPWCDERLLRFSMAYYGDPATHGLCCGLKQLRTELEAVTDEALMMYCPPPPLGRVMPLRIPLALLNLSRATAIPLPYLHQQFNHICARQDLRKRVFAAPSRGAA